MAKWAVVFFALLAVWHVGVAAVKVKGERRKWHKITLEFDGPTGLSETSNPNPFQDCNLLVTFSRGAKKFVVPGHYAADGNAANTGASRGLKWHVHFCPSSTGMWRWAASFKIGSKIAIHGRGGRIHKSIHGRKGAFFVGSTNKRGADNRGKGMLKYIGKHHLWWPETGKSFLKMGSDSPENFLAYSDFDNTGNIGGRRKHYRRHARHFRPGDPTWRKSKGKNIIGAINYMSSKGMNAMSFLTLSIRGDDGNVHPYVYPNQRRRFDVSKLAQWEIVFEHMDKRGIYLHFKMQERENDRLLTGEERILYYRELVARFSHHLALNWNVGEETKLTLGELLLASKQMRTIDPYKHHVVVHTKPGEVRKVYNPLVQQLRRRAIGFTGFSLQSGSPSLVYSQTREWVQKTAAAGRPLVIACDEQGPYRVGVKPDAVDRQHNSARKNIIWGNLMAGGAGVESYFGYDFPQNDLTMQDFSSRSVWWDQCRHAKVFFEKFVPFQAMEPLDGIAPGAWTLGKKGSRYVIYLRNGGGVTINLSRETLDFSIAWFNPSIGGSLRYGRIRCVRRKAKTFVRAPSKGRDWAALLWNGCGRSPPRK